jgi:phage terminase small subunit
VVITELKEQAKELFEHGKKLKDISAELNINGSTLRSWEKRYKWIKPSATKKCNKIKNVAPKITQEVSNKLNDKQQLFCEVFVNNFNATIAYLKIYQCDYNTAKVNGCKLLTNPNVRAYINELKEYKKQSLMIGESDIVEKFMKIAFADMTDFIEFGSFDVPLIVDGEIIKDVNDEIITTKESQLRLKESNQVDGGLICEISTSKQGAKIKLEDRQKALQWLSDYFEINPKDKHKVIYDNKKQKLDRDRFDYEKEKDKDKW